MSIEQIVRVFEGMNKRTFIGSFPQDYPVNPEFLWKVMLEAYKFGYGEGYEDAFEEE